MKHKAILTRERSEEEKRRRHIHGDKGAKFSQGKIPKIDRGGDWSVDHDDDQGHFADRAL